MATTTVAVPVLLAVIAPMDLAPMDLEATAPTAPAGIAPDRARPAGRGRSGLCGLTVRTVPIVRADSNVHPGKVPARPRSGSRPERRTATRFSTRFPLNTGRWPSSFSEAVFPPCGRPSSIRTLS